MTKTFAQVQKPGYTPAALPRRGTAAQPTLRPAAAGAGRDLSQVPTHTAGLSMGPKGSAFEAEAEAAAATLTEGARWDAAGGERASSATQHTAQGAAGLVQRQEDTKPKTDQEKYAEAGKKLGEAFLKTEVGKGIKDRAEQLGKDFLATLPGKIITGAAAAGALTALAAKNSELPAQLPDIPLDVVAPGLSVKITYEGPVRNPTAASISFTYDLGEASKAGQKSRPDRIREIPGRDGPHCRRSGQISRGTEDSRREKERRRIHGRLLAQQGQRPAQPAELAGVET